MKTFSKRTVSADQIRLIYRALWVTIAGNLFLSAAKFVAVRMSGSSALYSDALNSFSDLIYSLLVLIGMFFALRPPDPSHPQGHARFEPLIGIVIALSMGWAGFSAFLNAVEKIRFGAEPFAAGLPVATLTLSTLIKGAMYILIRRIADRVDSATLKAGAADNLADTLTSFTAIGGILLTKFGAPLADPIAAVLVSFWIFRAVFAVVKENLGFLTGAGITDAEREEIYRIANAIPGVLNVHQIIGEHIGSKHVLDLHVNIDGDMRLRDVHALESLISAKLRAEFPDIERVYIHFEPPEYR